MTINMYQADRNFVTPANDGSLYSGLVNDLSGVLKRGNKFNTTVSGLVVTVGTGQAVIQGRLVEIVAPESITVPANSSGNICLVVDLTKTNDVSGSAGDQSYAVTVNQVYLSAITGTLTQDDINNGGYVYELPIASFTSTATAVTVSSSIVMLGDLFNRVQTTTPPYISGSFSDYSSGQKLTAYKVNNQVYVMGAIANKYNLGTDITPTMFTLPIGWRPPQAYSSIQQASGVASYLLTINADGTGTFSRYRSGGSAVTAGAGNWLNVNASYPVGG